LTVNLSQAHLRPTSALKVLQHRSEAGDPCRVFLIVILPGITDTVASIEAVAKEHGVVSFGSAVLRLAPLVKAHYFDFVTATLPELLPW
jgi:hypothetical protein